MAGTGNIFQRLLGIVEQRDILQAALLTQAHQGFLQPLGFDGFQQIIKGMLFEGLHRILVKSGQKHDVRPVFRIEHPDHFQAADARHLNIEKQHVRAQLVHRANRFHRVAALPDYLNVAGGLQ